jgi:subtilisin family serine protease
VLAVIVALALTSGGGTPSLPAALSADPPAGVESAPGSNGSEAALAADDDGAEPGVPAPGAKGPAPKAARPAASAGQPPTPAGQPPKGEDVPEEWIVQLNDGESADAVAAEHAEEQDAEVHEVYTAALDGYSARMTDEEALAVAADPRVASVTRDRVFHATAQTTPPGIPRSNAIGIANAVSGATDVNADIAVLDTGVSSSHADLNYRAGKNCISSSSAPTDNNGHGTHVAGSAAARNNGDHVVGVAPGARVWSVKVLDSSGSGTTSQIVCGLNWVAQNAGTIEVATMSLGGGGSDDNNCGNSNNDSMHKAICNLVNGAGVPVTVAAGNEGRNASGHVPASYNEVITVSAYSDFDGKPGGQASGRCSEQDDTFAYFSNYGADVDITAPGVCILSTSRGGGTTTMSGTSMATPHVAGAVAAYMAKFGKVSPATVKTALLNGGTLDWSGDRDSTKEKALNLGFLGGTGLISGTSTPTTTTPPTTAAPTTTTPTTTTPTTTTPTTTTPPTTVAPTTTTTSAGGSSPISFTVVATTWDSGTKSKARVDWSNAPGAEIDVYRNGVFRTTATNDGNWGDQFSTKLPSGTQYRYKLCHLGTQICTAEKTVTFP